MDKFFIEGPTPLRGTIYVSGSKNAALPLMAAALLGNSASVLKNVPNLRDIDSFCRVLEETGTSVSRDLTRSTVTINPSSLTSPVAPYELVRKMRASFYMLGALLGSKGEATVSLPGGCAWGPRPVDLHLKGLEEMGARVGLKSGNVHAYFPSSHVKGGRFKLEPSSVGATVNLLLAAVLRADKFVIENAAQEPDVVLLCNTLLDMGASIEGTGTSTLTIRRVEALQGVEVTNDPDRIEAGTYMIAAAMHPESDLTIARCNPEHLGVFPAALKRTGARVLVEVDRIRVTAPQIIQPVSIQTDIYPGFPTDLQAQWATLMTQATGGSVVEDHIYFDRFSYVPELARLGAGIQLQEKSAVISGNSPLVGASVMSTDLRASVSLVMAAMIAKGQSQVLRVYHLDRGYEGLEKKLNSIGASIRRIPEGENPV